MPGWVDAGVLEYSKRLPADFALSLQELPLARRGRNSSSEHLRNKEAEAILAKLRPADHVVVLDVLGKRFDTGSFASRLDTLRGNGRDVVIVVGGPDGLGDQVLQRAEERWSLSDLTLPHPLVRIVLAEQFYRAWSLLSNHPYHRDG
jgi:23S rRNA (pseudouridine1915-N3)-methyltransferase